MHKLRLKKLETKQRAQEERSKRDAEIQRVRNTPNNTLPKTPFNNYRNHIAGMLYRNIVSLCNQRGVNKLRSRGLSLLNLKRTIQ